MRRVYFYWDAKTYVPNDYDEKSTSVWNAVDDGEMCICYKHANTTGVDAVLEDGYVRCPDHRYQYEISGLVQARIGCERLT
jgi:hypothetical protein